ncbi:hypothetical protein AB205_0045150, partial [Aquarana catesbeiana]
SLFHRVKNSVHLLIIIWGIRTQRRLQLTDEFQQASTSLNLLLRCSILRGRQGGRQRPPPLGAQQMPELTNNPLSKGRQGLITSWARPSIFHRPIQGAPARVFPRIQHPSWGREATPAPGLWEHRSYETSHLTPHCQGAEWQFPTIPVLSSQVCAPAGCCEHYEGILVMQHNQQQQHTGSGSQGQCDWPLLPV